MNFSEFKKKYIKVPVVEHPNNREGKVPLVTVKVVTYNHVNYIKQCLDSILMQKTDFDYEILIAEDDSNDGTREICIKYANKHPDKIRLLLNSRENNIPINNKPSGTFNSVYANYCVKSKYINLVEGDDYWTDENSLQKRVDFLENNEDFILCFHNSKVYDEFEKKFRKNKIINFTRDKIIKSENIIFTGIPTSTLMYRGGFIEIFDPAMLNYLYGDLILLSKLSQFGKGMFLSNLSDAVYRVHRNGLYSGGSMDFQIKNSIKTIKYLKRYFEKKGWNTKIIYKGLFFNYLNFFFSKIISEKEFNIFFLKKSIKYSKLAGKSFTAHSILYCYKRLKRKLL